MPITQRKNMILGQLYTNDIQDKRILDAISSVPREDFLPANLKGAAYADEDLDVGNGRALMAPLTFATLLDLAEIKPADRVLVIGALSGYTAAIIAQLARQIVATDIDAALIEQGKNHMKRLGIGNVTFQHAATLGEGYAASAPYDVIFIAGAIEVIPEAVGSQPAQNGRLVAIRNKSKRPDSKTGLGKGLLVRRIDNALQHREHFDASATLLPGFMQKTGFAF